MQHKFVDYNEITIRLTALCDGETDEIALMASVACELFHADNRFDWVGFYRHVAHELLKVGPYQGTHGCLTIPFGKGVCGVAAACGETQIVGDVNGFPGHIACATSTRSEIVVPVFGANGDLLAVLDIDSNRPAAFGEADRRGLEDLMTVLFGDIQVPDNAYGRIETRT